MQVARSLLNSARTQWSFLCLATLVAVGIGVVAAGRIARTLQLDRIGAAESDDVRARLRAVRATPPAASSETVASDFSARLPSWIDTQAVLSAIQRTCAQAEVSFSGIQVQPRFATTEQLSRIDVIVTLRGSYPRIKQVLAELLEKFPGVTLSHLSMRRSGVAIDVEATAVFAVWGGPAALPSSVSVPSSEPGSR